MDRRMLLAAAWIAATGTAISAEYALDFTAGSTGNALVANAAGAKGADSPDAGNGVLRRFALGSDEAPAPCTYAVGDVIEVALFPDVVLPVRLVERTPSSGGRATFLATVEGYGEACNAVVVSTPDGVQIDIQDYLFGRVYTVASGPDGVTVSELDPNSAPQTCGCADGTLPPVPAARPSAPQLESNAAAVANADSTYVDIMVAYDTMAADYARSSLGGITNFAETCVQKMNTAIANTGLTSKFRFRLVGVFAAPGNAAGSLANVLNSIKNEGTTLNGYNWSELEDVRKACSADVVSVLVDNYKDYGTTGRGSSYDPSWASYFADSAYNVCLIRAVEKGHTMTHEVGHNMGAGHATEVNPEQITPGPQYYDFSAGYYFTAKGEDYCTIMAYNFDGYGNSFTQIPYFSSPSHFYNGTAVGDAMHDNTRTLRNTFSAVAKFRTADYEVADIGAALGLSAYKWYTTGTYPWSTTSGNGVARSYESGGKPGVSTLYTYIVGPATVTFSAYMQSCGTFAVGYDDTTLFAEADYYSKTFSNRSVSIPAGIHRLNISCSNDSWEWYNDNDGVWLKSLSVSGGKPYRPGYTVVFNRNDGSDKTSSQTIEAGETARLSSLNSLGWARKGFEFKGWATAANSSVVRYANYANVRDIAGSDETLNLYAVWKLASGYYEIRFNKFDGSGAWRSIAFPYGESTRMPTLAGGLGWAKRGFDFQGWALSSTDASAGKYWKKDWSNVASPTEAGKTLNVWAAWKPKDGYYILRFMRNDGTAAWRAVGFQYGVKTRMPSLAGGLGWAKTDRKFKGWSLSSNGTIWKGDWAYLTSPFPAGSVKYVYAIWE